MISTTAVFLIVLPILVVVFTLMDPLGALKPDRPSSVEALPVLPVSKALPTPAAPAAHALPTPVVLPRSVAATRSVPQSEDSTLSTGHADAQEESSVPHAIGSSDSEAAPVQHHEGDDDEVIVDAPDDWQEQLARIAEADSYIDYSESEVIPPFLAVAKSGAKRQVPVSASG